MSLALARDPASNGMCVPAAIALITGCHVDTAVAMIQQVRGNGRKVRGVAQHDYLTVFDRLGWEMKPQPMLPPEKIDDPKYKKYDACGRATLGRYLTEMKSHRDPEAVYLLRVTGHVMVLQGDRIYDNAPHRRAGVNVASLDSFKRSRLTGVWLATKVRDVVDVPTAAPVQPKPSATRPGTMRALMLAALTSDRSLAELMKIAGWQAHTTRGFLSTLRKTHPLTKSKVNGVTTYRLSAADRFFVEVK